MRSATAREQGNGAPAARRDAKDDARHKDYMATQAALKEINRLEFEAMIEERKALEAMAKDLNAALFG